MRQHKQFNGHVRACLKRTDEPDDRVYKYACYHQARCWFPREDAWIWLRNRRSWKLYRRTQWHAK